LNIPASFRAGDTLAWTESTSDYPAPTYTLKFSLWKFGEAVKTIIGVANGADHDFDVAVASSVMFAAGTWKWTAYAEKGSGGTLERYTIGSGEVLINPCLASTGSTADLRSHAEKMLDAIEAVQLGRATHAEMSLTINGKAIQYLKPDELIRWRAFFKNEVAEEKRKEDVAQGKSSSRRIVTEFR